MAQQTSNPLDKGRNQVVNELHQNPGNFASTLYSERTTGPFWKRQLETSSPFFETNNSALCCLIENTCSSSEAKPLSHQGKESETRLVTSGPTNQRRYHVLKIYNLDSLNIRFFDTPRIPPLWSPKCFYPDVADLLYLGSDNFTNEYLIGFILKDLYFRAQSTNTRLNGIIDFISVTVCNSGNSKKSVILMEYANLGDIINLVRNPLNSEFRDVQIFTDQANNPVELDSLKPKIIVDICKQVIANLEFLHDEIEFNHGDLKANNVLVQNTPSRGNYKALAWNSEITVKMADFAKSSLTITDKSNRRIRVFNYSSYAERYQAAFPFIPSINSQFAEPYYIMDANTNVAALTWIRHLGIPFYFSWDTYTFMISLLLIPEIFYPVMIDPKLSPRLRPVLFDSLWFLDESSTAYNRLNNAIQQRKPNSYSLVLDILGGLKLKCRANTILLEGLKTV